MLFSHAALLSVSLSIAPPSAHANLTPAQGMQQEDRKAEFEQKLKEAAGSVEKLWKVYDWCEAHGMDKEGRSALRALLKVDDSDRKAHELLGEKEFDGKWFPNDKKLEEYKQKKLEEDAKKAGKVLYKGEFVDAADVPYLERGLKKLADGRWVSAEEHQRVTEGWVRQDVEWVPPAEAANIEKGLFKCGDKWLSEADANAFHAELGKWWRIPSDHFVIYSTCSRAVALKARDEAERAFRDFNRVLGKSPTEPVAVLVLSSGDQYNQFANTQGVELRGFSSLHGATMAEVWTAPIRDGLATTSAAYCYWDASTKETEAFGPFFVRHAAGQALAEALDPSPKTAAALFGGKAVGAVEKEWYAEKKFPTWFRYGAASYVERYIVDQFVEVGGNPLWMREWALQNIINKGGVDKIDDIFAMALSIDTDTTKTQSAKLIQEAGLVMAFVLDGKCAPVAKEHGALKDALKNGKDSKAAFKALEDAIRKNEGELRKFAGV